MSKSKGTSHRSKGTGSIVELTDKKRSKPYRARICRYDEFGRRVWISLGVYKKKREANAAINAALANGVSLKPSATFSDIFEMWKSGAYKKISESSQATYDAAFNLLKPLHGRRFIDLKVNSYQRIINSLDKSTSTLNKVKILVKQMYDYAILNDLASKNYARGIVVPKKDTKPRETFTAEEIQTLKDNDDKPWIDSVLVLIYTGFRVQELMNIRPEDVDLEADTITGGIKTDAGKDRTVPIHPDILKYIKARMSSCSDYVFETPGGGHDPDNYRSRCYKTALKSVGIPYKSPHCCRHTCATLMAKNGASTLAIQRILGHSSYAVTADIYTHSDLDTLRAAIAVM